MSIDIDKEFAEWWEAHGQFHRAGGGEYEMTFAYRAYEAAAKRHAAQVAEPSAEDYSDMLRELCCHLGVGGYNSEGLIDPAKARAKIDDGIDTIVRVESERAMRAAAPYGASVEGDGPNSMCERKTDHIMQRDGYGKTGYVLMHRDPVSLICVSDGGAVSWFSRDQWNWLMHNRDHVEFTWPKPIAAMSPNKEGSNGK